MTNAPYTSLADFAATWTDRPERAPFAAWPSARAPRLPPQIAERVDEIVDTVVAVQRAEWLQEGAYLGPRAMPEVWRAVLDAARTLKVVVPVGIVARVGPSDQGVHGTDDRPFLLLSSAFVQTAEPTEVRFIVGRQIGHMAAQQVTARSVYRLLVDHNGIRRVARRAVGPTLEFVLAPTSLALRLALSRWHRVAELTADRAGLLVAGDLDAARKALLRCALGDAATLSVEDYLHSNRAQDPGPGRWSELLADRPWLHKRIRALELWSRSEPYVALGGTPTAQPLIDAATLERRTRALLSVSP